MAIEYNFKYMPLVGKLSGKSMTEQTETAINEIARIVNENTAQAEIINTLAEEANANSVEALEKANEAIDTASRVYLKQTTAVNLNDYCESQLLYINNLSSTNLPVNDKGFLEVKTNDDKTQATQVYIDNTNKNLHVRTGTITAQQVGDVTNYVASYGAWVKISNASDLADYLPLSGGTMTGELKLATIKNAGTDAVRVSGGSDTMPSTGAMITLFHKDHANSGWFRISANNGSLTKIFEGKPDGTLTWGGQNILTASNYNSYALPLSGETMTGNITWNMTDTRLKKSNENGAISLYGGTSWSTSPSLALYGSGNSNNPGCFDLSAHDGTTRKQLIGKPDGTLTWGGQNILTASNYNSYALPLSGGTMTGNIIFDNSGIYGIPIKQKYDSAAIRFYGGTDDSSANLWLFGKNSAGAGRFDLIANDGSGNKVLRGSADGTLTWSGQPLLPVGVVQAFAGTTIPNGWLLCDGSAVSRTTYANLYACIGDTYGAGDGSTTFNLPNLVDKFIEGSSAAGTEKSAGLPNISGEMISPANGGWSSNINNGLFVSGAKTSDYRTNLESNANGLTQTQTFDASRANSIYGNSTTVQPPALTMKYIIKY